MPATLSWATQFTVTVRVLTITTLEEQPGHVKAYAAHGYQHKSTHRVGAIWIMSFVKSTVLLNTTDGDTVPL